MNRRRHIIYIINPISGTSGKKSLRRLIEKETLEKNIPFDIFPSVASGDYSFLEEVIREKKVTDVVVAGGDGTFSQVVGSLIKEKLNFGIIPCGSGNGLALAAGISRTPAKALDIIFNGIARAVDGFTVNGKFACMLCGLGFDAKVAHEFADQPHRGLKTYASLVTKNFFSAKTYSFRMQSQGEKVSTHAFFISVANSNQFGNQVTIAPQASLRDGLLDIVVVQKSVKPLLLFNILRQVVAGKIKPLATSLDSPVIYFQTSSLTIENLDEAPMHLDGDPSETFSRLQIKVLPLCFRLLQKAV
jgi:YegS/Rv2252/BmrU family lipid kinase